MSKVALERVTSSFGFQAAYNDTLAKIENEFTEKVLYRDNPEGTTNEMKNDLDMGTHDVLNVKMVDAQQFRVGGVDLDNAVNQLIDDLNTIPAETMGYRDEAIAARNAAQLAESGAQASEAAAQASALTASTKASAAAASASQAAVSASIAFAEKQLALLFSGNASQSATDALGHANDAAASAAQASASESVAAASALAADASADAAAISEANAASSASAANLSAIDADSSEAAALQYKNDIIDLFADYTLDGLHTHTNKTVLDGTQEPFTTALKTKLDGVAPNANNYVLPVASSALGGVKSGTDITVDASGNVSVNDNSHDHTIANVTSLQTSLNAKAPLASPALTGTPTAPTAAVGTNTTQVATTAFVNSEIANDAVLKTGGTMSGDLTFSDDNEGIALNGGARVYKKTGYGIALKRPTADTDPVVENNAGTTVYKLWHEGNDGAGSTLDADLLDGQQGSYYLDWANVTNKPDPVITLAGDATGSVTLTDVGSGTLTVAVVDDSHNHIISNVDNLQTTLDGKVPTTRTVNTKPLSADVVLTTADIADSLNKRYVTDAHLTLLGNTSGTNSGNETTTTVGALINGATAKTTPVDADMVGLMDSAASNVLKKLSWLNIKATLKTYFDTLYSLAAHVHAVATTSVAGFMSSTDKTKLDGIQAGAQVNANITKVEIEAKLTGEISTHSHAGGGIAADSITNVLLANMAVSTIKGRATAGTGDPEDLTATQVRTILNVADGAQKNSDILKSEIEAKLIGLISSHEHTNCDTVDGFHAQKTPAADKIPVAGADGKLDAAWIPDDGGPTFPANQTFPVGTSSFTVPAGITRIAVDITGGGGSSGSSSSSGSKYAGMAGGSSSFGSYITATGGAGGPAGGGTGANGSISGGGTPYVAPWGGIAAAAGGVSSISTGGNGGCTNVLLDVTPGEIINIAVGAGGAVAATSGVKGVSGQNGSVQVWYFM